MDLINQLSTLAHKVNNDQGGVEALAEKKVEAKRMNTLKNLVEHNMTIQQKYKIKMKGKSAQVYPTMTSSCWISIV